MDHMYAASVPPTEGADNMSPPNVAAYLLDHNFARPPSESPLVSCKIKPSQSVSTRRMSNGQGERQPSPEKSPTKGSRRPRRPSHKAPQSPHHKTSSRITEDEEDGEFIPVATISTPNSPAGMRSLLAEHLLSASVIPNISQPVSDPPSEDSLTAENPGENHDVKDMEATGDGQADISQCHYEEHPEEDAVTLTLEEEGSKEEEKLDEPAAQDGKTESSNFLEEPCSSTADRDSVEKPGEIESQNLRPVDINTSDVDLSVSHNHADQSVINSSEVMDTEGTESSPKLPETEESDVSDPSLNKTSIDSLTVSSCSNNDVGHETQEKSAVLNGQELTDVRDSSETVSIDKKNLDVSESLEEQSAVPAGSSSMVPEEMEVDIGSEEAGGSKSENIPVNSSADGTDAGERDNTTTSTSSGGGSSQTGIAYSISELVKLKKNSSPTAKTQNIASDSESRHAHVAGKKRRAEEAGLDDSQSKVAEDQTATSVTQCKPSDQDVPDSQQISSPKSTSKSSKSKTSPISPKKVPAKKPRLPKADPSELPFDVEPFLIPLTDHGWKRELVMRGVFDELTSSGSKRKNAPADVYYFTPDGKKLRSKVMIASYLNEHPTTSLTIDNFSFFKQPISEEPYESVRQAGKPKSGASKNVKVSKVQTPKIPRVKIKIGSGKVVKVTTTKDSESASTGSTSTRTPVSYSPSVKSSYSRFSIDADGDDSEDEDYDPWNEGQTPKWNKSRVFRIKSKKSRPSPEREILIQAMPEPDIVIDRAEESPHIIESESSVNKDNQTADANEGKAPRMMLLPGDIKEEKLDSDEEEKRKDDNGSNDIGTVHIHRSPVAKPARSKPTARKSTMPRIAFKKTSSSSKSKEVPLSDGQLCTNACPGLDGVAPTLQCCVCMCLFHHQCVNVHPGDKTPFKCLRCKDVPTSQADVSWPSKKSRSPLNSSPGVTAVSATPTSSGPVPVRTVVYVRRPVQPPGVMPTGTLPYQQPYISVVRPALVPSAPEVAGAQTKTDAIDLLRKLTARTSMASVPTSVRPGPVPPQLILGGAAPLSHQSTKLPLPRLAVRPPPRLTAAPGVKVSSCPLTSTSIAVGTCSSSSTPLVVTSGSQPQPQMMTLPSTLLSRLNLSQPLAVKLNNAQVVVPPSCIINSQDGLKSTFSSVKVLLPPSTFPVPPDSNAKVSVTISNNTITTTAGSVPTTTTSASSRLPVVSSQDRVVNSSKLPSEGVQTRRGQRQRNQSGIDFTQCTMHRLFSGFDCMLQIFQYLSIFDLLRSSRVCRTWQQIARQKCLWQTLDLRTVNVTNWERAVAFMRTVGTQNLCLQNVQRDYSTDSRQTLLCSQVINSLGALMGLRRIEFSLVPSSVLHCLAEKLTELEVLHAEHISDFSDERMWTIKTKLDFGKLAGLTKLQELRLRGVSGLALPTFTFNGSLPELAKLQHLHTLSLTSLYGLRDRDFYFLNNLAQLEVLELGDCLNWTSQTYSLLGELCQLRRLRLECGGEIPDIGVGEALLKLTKLERLELILFAIPASLAEALSQLPLLDTLVMWPDTSHGIMPAVVNSHALTAVVNLKQLKTLEWGVVIKQSPKGAQVDSPSSEQHSTIPLLRPYSTLDPEVERDSSMVINMSVTQFTEKLCLSLPNSTAIKVFNTQVVSRDTV